MNQHLHSPTKLTEFARDFEDEPETLFGRLVNRIQNAYNQSYNSVNEVPSGTQPKAAKSTFYADVNTETGKPDMSRNSSSSSLTAMQPQQPNTLPVQTLSDASTSSTTTTTTEESNDLIETLDELPAEGRTMINVLKRIKTMVASKNSNLRNYKDTDLQRFWMPDSKAKECYDCTQKFSTFRRKHHCRLCGQIFCSKCCNQAVTGTIIKCSGDLKVCNYCSKIVLSYLQSPNIAVDLHSDLQALQQDLSNKLDDKDVVTNVNLLPTHTQSTRKASVGYQEERFAIHQANNLSIDDRKNILQQSNLLITLLEEMQRVLPAQNCGLDLIEFLNSNYKYTDKTQALATLSAMLAAGFLQPIVPDSDQFEFDENLHYKFVELPSRQVLDSFSFSDFADISHAPSPQFDSTGEPQPPKSIDATSVHDIEMENSIRSMTTTAKLIEAYCDHEEQLLSQMLRTYHIDMRWSKVLTPLCCGAANHFKPEYCTNELMDIRNYVNFKKVPGGKRQECRIVGGVVFTKNVAHKEMATRIEQPRILLLQCPIVYERIEGKFVSISTVLLQEREYLSHVCARIMSFKPNVVLVQKNVAGIAQDILRSQGITLVLDVKLSVMERLSRTLQCDILTSIESNIAKPQLGICDAFYIQSFEDGNGRSKTLMFFEKLNSPRGFTCLLRGGNNNELATVKKVASFFVYARYNWRLEMSFLLDEFAQPLSPKRPIFDSKEPSPDDEDNENNMPPMNEEAQLRSVTPKRIMERRSDDKILTAITENVFDFTDPLRSTDNTLSTLELAPVKLAVEMRYDNRFRNALSSTLLSVSPFLTFPLPYLETEAGRKCALRPLFPAELYFSKLWSNSNNSTNNLERIESGDLVVVTNDDKRTELNPPHPFLKLKITTPIDNRDIQTSLAEFRAFGGRYPKKKKMFKLLKPRNESYQRPQKINEDHVYKDALDLINHQRLPVLFCSFHYNPKSASSFCTPPTLLDMKFYGHQDIMLGQFLQRYCCPYSLTSICKLCNLPKLDHVRRYVHSMGCVQVFLSEDHTKSDPNRIYFTAWCSICNEVTPSVPLSDTTKSLSFAKYLDLRFHGHVYKKRPLDDRSTADVAQEKCQHSLHRDYIHYFSFRGVGAKFQYTSIEVWEIGLPALTLMLQPPKPYNHFQVLEDMRNFSTKGHEVYTRIHERIADLAMEDENSPLVATLKTTLSKDQFIFKQHVEIIQMLLTEAKANAYDINDALIMSKRVLAESIELWGPRLHEIALAQRSAAKQQQQPHNDSGHHVDAGTICTEESIRSEHPSNMPETPHSTHSDNSIQAEEQQDAMDTAINNSNTTIEKKSSVEQPVYATSVSLDKKSIKKMLIHLLPSTGPTNLLQSPFNAQEHYTLPMGAFPVLVHDNDLSSIIAYTLTSCDYQRKVATLGTATKQMYSSSGDSQGSNVVQSGIVANQSPNLRRKLQENSNGNDDTGNEVPTKVSSNSNNNNNNNNSSNTNDDERIKSKSNFDHHIELTFQDNGTQLTCKIYFAKEFDVMRAKMLKPPNLGKSMYKEMEKSKKREELKVSQSRSGPEMELVRKPSDVCQNPLKRNQNETKDENVLLQEKIDECRNMLARSLCSSVQWEARGGKSGSRFCKTLDDRFVLKEMSKSDVSIFGNFAPNYFDYINNCQEQQQPTLLAKIFGVFKVTIKKKDFFQEKSLLVMENLFYDCDIKNKFDLKGSERNRLVDPTNQLGEIVLLDENLMQMSWSKPLYMLSHTKAVLKDAINRDASFLEKNRVMDYSLLVGLDNKNGVLVLGIIDYIRTYTFDKKVESFVKQTGILGGGMGKLPTVVCPERYKQRFNESMDRYFYTVPDRWEGLSKI